MKKVLSLLLSLLLLACLCAPAMAEDAINIVWHTTQDAYLAAKEVNPDAFDPVWSVIPEFEETYGVKVNVRAVAWGDMKPTAISMINSGESLDLVQANDQSFPVYPARNIIQPIGEYVDLTDGVYSPAVLNAFTFGGQQYAAGADVVPLVMYYNVDLFESNGVDLPRDLYEAGEWDWDAFARVATELTYDSDNDGEDDVFGFGYWDTDYTVFLASNGTTHLIYNDDGTISTGYLTDAGIEAMTFVQNCYTVNKCMWPISGNDSFVGAFRNSKLAMTMEYGFGIKSSELDGNLPFEVDWVPAPKGPSGEGDVSMSVVTGWSIGVTSANPTAAGNFIKMSTDMLVKAQTILSEERYGADKVAEMNALGARAKFVPIGIDKYWDNNYVVYTGVRSNTPVVNFLTEATELVKSGYESTLSN